ncbi:MAG: glycosyltransferase family 4 protein [Candidatus Buchananbacteria bacterium]
MKLLMITRKVDKNDWLAGFTYNWVKKIGEKVDKLYVICLAKGDLTGLPENIEVYSIGKELGNNYWQKFWLWQKLAGQLVPQVDGIFCHMNPEYTIAIWPYARSFGKKIISWYTHSKVSWKTRLMEKLTSRVLTASALSFRLPSKKVKVVGHGIDTEIFKPLEKPKITEGVFNILTVGRISPTKSYETMIEAVSILAQQGLEISLEIIGGIGLPQHQPYLDSLKQMVKNLNLSDRIIFLGTKTPLEVRDYLQQAEVFINLSGTGSLDKAVLEAMACGCLVLTSNEAFKEILPPELMVEKNQPQKLAEKISWFQQLSAEQEIRFSEFLRAEIKRYHSLDGLVLKIIEQF